MKLTKLFTLLLVSAFMLLNTQCATIINGSKQEVPFRSTPSGAKITVQGEFVGETPATVDLKRNLDNADVKIKLDGYKPYEMTLHRKFNAWFVGNLIFGGIPGMIIDAATGAMYKLDPKDVRAKLKEKSSQKDEGGIGMNNADEDVIYVFLEKEYEGDLSDRIGTLKKE